MSTKSRSLGPAVIKAGAGRRKPGAWCLVTVAAALGLLSPSGARAAPNVSAERRFSVRPRPSWIEFVRVEVPKHPPDGGASQGIEYLLSDRQVRVLPDRETYRHTARRIVNAAGLDSASQVAVDFDPSYQQLCFHSIGIIRGGVWTTRMKPKEWKLLQREEGLESQIYDGSFSAVYFVEDVRVGDILDCEYTVSGSNPILGGRYIDTFSTEWAVPLDLMRFRLLWPRERVLHVKNHQTKIAPVTRDMGRIRETVWEVQRSPAIRNQPGAPSWFDTYGWVQLSEFEDWKEVVAWGRELFESTRAPNDAVARQVDPFRSLAPERAALLALRFVQDEIRYLGIELGTGAHRPSPPATVLARRYGDCKDKANLLCALLAELGISAHPVLVNGSSGPALGGWQPSPFAFDHAVVRIDLGETIWVDPTLQSQGGGLRETHFPSYGFVLPLAPGVENLVKTQPRTPKGPMRRVDEEYQIGDFHSPVKFAVTSTYEGPEADGMRRDFAESPKDDIARKYLKYYTRTWPGIAADGSLEVKDDREANVLSTVERYSIPQFWSTDAGGSRPEVELWAEGVGNVLREADRAERWAPYALSFPLHVSHSTRLHLPEEWDTEAEEKVVEDPSIRLRYRAKRDHRTLVLEYEFETRGDSVAPAAFPRYLKTAGQVREALAFRLRRPLLPGGPSGHVNWAALAVGCGAALIGLLAGLAVYQIRSRETGLGIPDPELQGLRGWLLVFASFVSLVLLVECGALAMSLGDYTLGVWLERTTPAGDEYLAAWQPLLLVDLTARVLAATGALTILALLMGRRQTLRVAWVGFAILYAALFALQVTMSTYVPARQGSATLAVLRGLLFIGPAAAWIPYLVQSERARSTLVRP